jgi:hypothetical protein
MATKTITLTGKASWAKVFEQNKDDKGFEGAYLAHDGACTINLELDSENFATLKDSGSAKRGSVGENGMNVKLVRKWTDVEWAGGAPKVTKPDGTPWVYETDGPIPNGSRVEATASVYTTRYRPGTRLETVHVLEVAEFEDRESAEVEDEMPF